MSPCGQPGKGYRYAEACGYEAAGSSPPISTRSGCVLRQPGG